MQRGWIKFFILIILSAGCHYPQATSERKALDTNEKLDVTSVTTPPSFLEADLFYKKYLNASGIPILGSDKVPDEAFYKVRNVVNSMVAKRKDVLDKLIENNLRVVIMATSELTKDIPEYSELEDEPGERTWNECRGIGATIAIPVSSCAEENVLCYGEGKDPYYNEDILIHEFAHGIYELGIAFIDKDFDSKLEEALSNAKSKGRWKDTYASTNIHEYFAEGVQCWFDQNDEATPANGIHNEINTREELKEYDPRLYAIISNYFPAGKETGSCHEPSDSNLIIHQYKNQ